MSIMDVATKARRGEITKNWLKKRSFYESRWGSPQARLLDNSIFYEAQVYTRDFDFPEAGINYVGDIMYFPETFNGYVNFDACRMRGFGATAGKVVIYLKHRWPHNNKEYEYFAASNTAELSDAIEALRLVMRENGEEMIIDRKIIKTYEDLV